jgi:hypothetical protein
LKPNAEASRHHAVGEVECSGLELRLEEADEVPLDRGRHRLAGRSDGRWGDGWKEAAGDFIAVVIAQLGGGRGLN